VDFAALKDAVRDWARAWARAWATHHADLIASLYADDAVFRSQPFREPQDPHVYARWAFDDEASAEVWFAEPVVEGDRALVEWWAISHGKDGRDTTLAGAASLWFGDDGRVRRQLDYWNQADDTAQPPPEGWGPVLAHER
jgi:ketosteroid isomerase-like protein